MPSVSPAGRAAAIGAVVLAIVVVAVLLFTGGGGGGYKVKAEFLNASQLVKGNLVQIGGTKVGTVDDIEISKDGQAVITLKISDDYAPLKQGTKATIRQASQSGIANRYVDLTLPSGDSDQQDDIEDGSTITIDKTTTAVDLDQLFNVFNPPTRKAVQDFFKNSGRLYGGKERQQRLAFRYLNPALSTSSRLFNELNRDTPRLERFLVDSARLVSTVAERRDDLAAFVGNANTTFRALGNQSDALSESVERLPDFMRTANTTFVNLRAALDDVDPLVDASKPVARKLEPFLNELRPLARDARPTVRDLNDIVLKPGRDNDLYNLTTTFPPLDSAANTTKRRSVDAGGGPRNVGTVRGAFPETVDALEGSTPIIAFGRPYTPDLFGWFDDFSTSGGQDAFGGWSRSQVVFNAFDATSSVPSVIPLPDRGDTFANTARIGQHRRCPGGGDVPASDRSNVFSAAERATFDCLEEDRAAGDIAP
jgi:phospholipid/cholesterol/gamma-HCH transport system substrate-binding protein